MNKGTKLKENRISLKGEIILNKEVVGRIREKDNIKYLCFDYGLSFEELKIVLGLIK